MKSICKIVIVAIVMVSSLVIPHVNGYANYPVNGSGISIQPMWINTHSITAGLTFSGTTANCVSRIVGLSGTTKITATFTLQRKVNGSYTTIKTWTETSSGSSLNFSDTHSVTRGFTYRLLVNATVTRNGVNETVSTFTENSL